MDILDRKEKDIGRREGLLVDKERSLESRHNELLRLIEEEKGKLQRISGLSVEEAKTLAIQLNAGALPVPISLIEERTVGATLGAESVATGTTIFLIPHLKL